MSLQNVTEAHRTEVETWLKECIEATKTQTVRELYPEFVALGLQGKCRQVDCQLCLVAQWLTAKLAQEKQLAADFTVTSQFVELPIYPPGAPVSRGASVRITPVLLTVIRLFDTHHMPEFAESVPSPAPVRHVSPVAYAQIYGSWSPPNARLTVVED